MGSGGIRGKLLTIPSGVLMTNYGRGRKTPAGPCRNTTDQMRYGPAIQTKPCLMYETQAYFYHCSDVVMVPQCGLQNFSVVRERRATKIAEQ
jgi:hypothetical protein